MAKIDTQCTACFSSFGVPDKYAGKRVKCPECGEPVKVESATEASRPSQLSKKKSPPPEDDYGDPSDDHSLDGMDLSEGETIKPKKKAKKPAKRFASNSSSSGSGGWDGSGLMLKGVLMMVGAVVWFVLGWRAGFIYFYPPVLLVIGLVTFVKGLMGSNE